MRHNFTLSTSNKIYYGVLAIFFIAVYVAYAEKTPYITGRLAGILIAFLLFPSLFAWIAWHLSGKKEKGASLTFNIVLTLIILGVVGRYGDRRRAAQERSEIQKEKEVLKKALSSAEDPAEIDTAYNKYVDSMRDRLNKLSETSTGQEKQLYETMNDFFNEMQTVTRNWWDSYHAVLSPRILDYSVLNSDEEFDHQKKVLSLYVENSKANKKDFMDIVPNLKKRLGVLDEGNKFMQEALKILTDKFLSKNKIFVPLMEAHIEYGKNMIQLLELLQNNKDEWVYENDELLIDSDDVLDKLNDLCEKLVVIESTITTLSAKWLDKL